jgi:hypothetical protein
VRSRTDSKARIEIGGRKVPVLPVSGRGPVDSARFIPVVSTGARAADRVRLIRRGDLLPKSGAAAAAGVQFGDQLVDVFAPDYGSYYPLGKAAFVFRRAKASFIVNTGWVLGLSPREPGEQLLEFAIERNTNGNYLKIDLSQTVSGTTGAILTVRVDGIQFNLDLTTRNYLYFDLYLLGPGTAAREVGFTLSSTVNALRGVICIIERIELYNSIRSQTDPVVYG